MRLLKNLIGYLLGYGKCKATGDTHWRNGLVNVFYAPNAAMIFSSRALTDVSAEKIARAVLKTTSDWYTHGAKRYSLDEIIENIRQRRGQSVGPPIYIASEN